MFVIVVFILHNLLTEDQCKGTGLVYRACGCNKTCQEYVAENKKCGSCSEGCFCPADHVLIDGKCSTAFDCKCAHDGVNYKVR